MDTRSQYNTTGNINFKPTQLTDQIGGFTCRIGDPSGRATAREQLSNSAAVSNINKITKQVQIIFQNFKLYAISKDFKESSFGRFEIVNNDTWWKDLKFSDFLTNIAQHMRLGPMLGRERYLCPLT